MKHLLLYLLIHQDPTVPLARTPTPIIVSVASPGYVLTDPGALFHARPHTCRAWAESVLKATLVQQGVPTGTKVSYRFHCENGI